MTPDQLQADLAAALTDRRRLDHPFYRRWDAGRLQLDELGSYFVEVPVSASVPLVWVRIAGDAPSSADPGNCRARTPHWTTRKCR